MKNKNLNKKKINKYEKPKEVFAWLRMLLLLLLIGTLKVFQILNSNGLFNGLKINSAIVEATHQKHKINSNKINNK